MLTYGLILVGGIWGPIYVFFLGNLFKLHLLYQILGYEPFVALSFFAVIILKRGHFFRQKFTALIEAPLPEKSTEPPEVVAMFDVFKTEEKFNGPGGDYIVDLSKAAFQVGGHAYLEYEKGKETPKAVQNKMAKGSAAIMRHVNKGIVGKLLERAGLDPASFKAQYWLLLLGIAFGFVMALAMIGIPTVAKVLDPNFNKTVTQAIIG
jgi:hypothetical protein